MTTLFLRPAPPYGPCYAFPGQPCAKAGTQEAPTPAASSCAGDPRSSTTGFLRHFCAAAWGRLRGDDGSGDAAGRPPSGAPVLSRLAARTKGMPPLVWDVPNQGLRSRAGRRKQRLLTPVMRRTRHAPGAVWDVPNRALDVPASGRRDRLEAPLHRRRRTWRRRFGTSQTGGWRCGPRANGTVWRPPLGSEEGRCRDRLGRPKQQLERTIREATGPGFDGHCTAAQEATARVWDVPNRPLDVRAGCRPDWLRVTSRCGRGTDLHRFGTSQTKPCVFARTPRDQG